MKFFLIMGACLLSIYSNYGYCAAASSSGFPEDSYDEHMQRLSPAARNAYRFLTRDMSELDKGKSRDFLAARNPELIESILRCAAVVAEGPLSYGDFSLLTGFFAYGSTDEAIKSTADHLRRFEAYGLSLINKAYIIKELAGIPTDEERSLTVRCALDFMGDASRTESAWAPTKTEGNMCQDIIEILAGITGVEEKESFLRHMKDPFLLGLIDHDFLNAVADLTKVESTEERTFIIEQAKRLSTLDLGGVSFHSQGWGGCLIGALLNVGNVLGIERIVGQVLALDLESIPADDRMGYIIGFIGKSDEEREELGS